MATRIKAAEEKEIEAAMVDAHEVLATAFDFSKKDNLLALYEILKNLNVRSIGDLEGLIARAE